MAIFCTAHVLVAFTSKRLNNVPLIFSVIRTVRWFGSRAEKIGMINSIRKRIIYTMNHTKKRNSANVGYVMCTLYEVWILVRVIRNHTMIHGKRIHTYVNGILQGISCFIRVDGRSMTNKLTMLLHTVIHTCEIQR